MEDINWSKTMQQANKLILAEKKVKAGLRAEELREKLDPEAAIVGLMNLAEQSKHCELEDLARLKFQSDILTTILKKCMPDLKSLEVKEKNSSATTLIIDMKR